jgi:hypothetical protein
MNYSTYVPFGLQIGTRVFIQIGLIEHVGLVSDYTPWGKPIVMSISQQKGFVEEPLSEFAKVQGAFRFDYPSKLNSFVVMQRAYSMARKSYNLANWNCEHFASYAHGLPVVSPQVARAATFALAAIAILALARA